MSENIQAISEQGELPPPPIVSRDIYTEGGFTFLKRALRTAVTDPAGRVIIDSDGLHIEYNLDPENKTFMDGIKTIDGTNPDALRGFEETASQYDVQLGLLELAEEENKNVQ